MHDDWRRTPPPPPAPRGVGRNPEGDTQSDPGLMRVHSLKITGTVVTA